MSDFSCKEIININNGCRFGNVSDVVFDMEIGSITALIVPAKRDGVGFFERSYEYEIPWDKVKRIGDDYIFVDFEAPPRNMTQKRRSFF